MKRLTVPTAAAAGLVALAVLAACSDGGSAVPSPTRTSPSLFGSGLAVIETDAGDVRLEVEVADTQPARERGLMNRTRLDADAGMAFVFDSPISAAFWMKDTLIPLSIAFWDAEGRIVAIEDMEPCRADPCPLTQAPGPVVGALEVNQGFFADHGVRVGDRIRVARKASPAP
jgi:uncharacterized membrane protein (UPF0127 family)